MIDEMVKIIRINAYIQRNLGKVYLNGNEVESVCLDRSWADEGDYDPDRLLTDEQLDDLFRQTFGAQPESEVR